LPQDTVDIQFLGKQLQGLIEETRHLRKEVSDVRSLTLQTYEFSKRIERRNAELKDDLEITIKMELGGGLSNLQAAIEGSLARIEGRFEGLEERVSIIERSPGAS
jgi:DNA repair exonuclease SbcCD ATPase subunit